MSARRSTEPAGGAGRPGGESLDERFGRLAERWVGWVLPRSATALALLAVATLALAAAAWRGLAIDSNEDLLFSDTVEFVSRRADWSAAFPHFSDPIVVVIDAETDDEAHVAARTLAERLRQRPDAIARLAQPGGEPFFERNGLLYLETDELAELGDRLAAAQPYLAELSRDPSAPALLALLGRAVVAAREGELPVGGLDEAIDRVQRVIASHAAGDPVTLSWSQWMLGAAAPTEHRRFLLVEPHFDFARIDPAGPAIETLRAAIAELGLAAGASNGATARLTGVYALAQEETAVVEQQATWAGVASFVLVALVLIPGLGSLRVALVALGTLIASLVWTAGFAALAIGHLNLVSVAFAVLVIGLGIDFGVHVCVRALELRSQGAPASVSLRGAARDIGGSLVICAATTAFAFYAFVPTDYRGVAELGLIAGTSMFFSLFLSLTLLPALLARFGPATVRPRRTPRPVRLLAALPARRPRLVLGLAAGIAVAAAFAVPKLRFDENPLRMRDPSTESVQVFDELLASGQAFPWNMNALAPDPAAAARLGERLAALPSVDHTLTLADFVPAEQEAKLAILDDLRFLLEPTLDRPPSDAADRPESTRVAIAKLADELERGAATALPAPIAASSERLRTAIEAFLRANPAADPAADARLAALDQALIAHLPEQLRRLRAALSAEPVTLESLPPDVRDPWVAIDGSVRVEVFPAQDLNENELLAAYVEEVRRIAPAAYGEGLVILESGRVVVRALQEALAVASIGIVLLLLVLWRDPLDAALGILPIALAALLTAAGSVWLGIPLNFANVIVIPLLVGMGVDSGIHLVHRLRSGDAPGGNLLDTSTARAVLLAALTTLASFGALGASTHPGLGSLGRLLALGLGCMLLANLVVLPAAGVVVGRSRAMALQPAGRSATPGEGSEGRA